MCLILTDYQSKTSIYNNGSTYMNLMVTMKQKSTIDTEKQNKKTQNITKENHQTTREQKK